MSQRGAPDERVAELAAESVAPIETELRRRLRMELGERELVAIETALIKAFVNGMRTGAGEAVERAVDADRTGLPPLVGGPQPMTPAELDPDLPWLDRWAERYGDDR